VLLPEGADGEADGSIAMRNQAESMHGRHL